MYHIIFKFLVKFKSIKLDFVMLKLVEVILSSLLTDLFEW